jgi:dTDP-4-dehydrorhamnose 3,5-epimerase
VIHGVTISPLRQIPDERGIIMHMMKRTDDVFGQFGEIYFSGVNPGAIKAWHIHKEMTLNYAVPMGQIKFVLYDSREDSPTCGTVQEIFVGSGNYVLVTVPPMVWNGFKGLGSSMSLVANCASHPHDPDEIERCDPFSPDIPYSWDIKHG